MTRSGTNSSLEILDTTDSELNEGINFDVTNGATILVNVSGTSIATGTGNWGESWNGTQTIGNSATMYENVIFNFYQAAGVTLEGTFQGTLSSYNTASVGLIRRRASN